MANRVANQPAPYRGLSGPSGTKCRKSLQNVSRGLRPRTPKSLQKVSGTIRKDSFDTLRRLSGGGPGRHFRDSFGISARETSVRGGLVRKNRVLWLLQLWELNQKNGFFCDFVCDLQSGSLPGERFVFFFCFFKAPGRGEVRFFIEKSRRGGSPRRGRGGRLWFSWGAFMVFLGAFMVLGGGVYGFLGGVLWFGLLEGSWFCLSAAVGGWGWGGCVGDASLPGGSWRLSLWGEQRMMSLLAGGRAWDRSVETKRTRALWTQSQ